MWPQKAHRGQCLHFTRENTLSNVPSHLPKKRVSRALCSIRGSGTCVWVQNGEDGVDEDENDGV